MNAIYLTVIGSATLVFAGVAVMHERPQSPAEAVSPPVIALGDSVFHGKVGGALCYVCHGPGGKGVAGLGPNLTDK